MDTKADKELLRLIKQDDQKALEVLFEKYYYRLCDFSFQYVRNFDLTEEIVSDVFLKIWIKRKKLKITGNFKAYIYTAARNQSLNYIQKENSELDSIEEQQFGIPSEKYNPEQELMFKEFENRIEGLINTLPSRRKQVFKLSRIEGLTYREIAKVLSISIHTVQNHMVQAVKQLSSYSILDK